MARMFGQSGSWQEIERRLLRYDIRVSSPKDLAPALEQLHKEFQPAIEQKKRDILADIAKVRQRIVLLQQQKGILNKIVNWFRIKKEEARCERLKVLPAHFEQRLIQRIDLLKITLESKELFGAQAEIAVMTQLQQLPDSFIVINDVNLSLTRSIQFDGNWLRSSQIDHVVISPSGVFVIETKRWSKNFADSRGFHDPYDQVKRAGYICHLLFSSRLGTKIKVRTIIASFGHIPPRPPDSYAKVLAPKEIVGYIKWFKKTELSPEQQNQICQLCR